MKPRPVHLGVLAALVGLLAACGGGGEPAGGGSPAYRRAGSSTPLEPGRTPPRGGPTRAATPGLAAPVGPTTASATSGGTLVGSRAFKVTGDALMQVLVQP